LLIRQQLQAPKTVQLRLDNQRLLISGIAPAAWINSLPQKSTVLSPALDLIINDHDNQLQAEEWLQAIALQQTLDGMSFYFSQGIGFNDEQQSQMQAQLNKISQLQTLLDITKTNAHYILKGYTDAVGDTAYNQALQFKRAQTIKQQLQLSGVNSASISIEAGQIIVDSKQRDVSMRRVDLQIRFQSD
jgi:outer membrane protein OmpA-like peptidoglycan-associated protein